MLTQVENSRQELINKICDHLKNRVSAKQAVLIETFAQRYLVSSSLTDLTERSIEDLSGALFSIWNFIHHRAPHEAKVKVFNPTFEKDGWQSSHTIIEISHDDIPFLVDSARMEINRAGLQIHFIIHMGGLKVRRDKQNKVIEILPVDETATADVTTEAPIYIEIDRLVDSDAMDALADRIKKIFGDVVVAVQDWRKMVERVEQALQELEQDPPPLDPAEISESKDFLRWLINNNFTFLGSRDYKLIGNETNRALQIIPGTGLGVLREDNSTRISKSYADLPPQARKLALSRNILIIAKTNTKSTVHRDAYTDYIGVKRFNKKGEVIGERRFIGLYTSTAYNSSPRQIPFLRHKVEKIIQDLKYPPDSHNGKEAVHILETLPRDDLFQATHEELLNLTMGIIHLQERKQVRLFLRKDSYSRYFSCLVYVPRENFNTDLCLAMEEILVNELHGIEASYTSYFSDSALARIHFLIRINPKITIEYNVKQLEKKLANVARLWSDELKTQLIGYFGEAEGLKLYYKYFRAFPAGYMEAYQPHFAMFDIEHIERLSEIKPLEMRFYRTSEKNSQKLRLKLFHAEHTIPLSDVLPTLENLGLRVIGERQHEVIFKDGRTVWINDFDMLYTKNPDIDIQPIRETFQEAFEKIWSHAAENDSFNHLVIEAQLTWQETAMLRAYTRYLRQIGFTFSQSYIEQALTNNPAIAKSLIELFKLRFSPEIPAEQRAEVPVLMAKIEETLDSVISLDEDRIIRRMLEVIMATIRTNYFQKTAEGNAKSYLSLKFDPSLISDLPLPRPMYEIFVYSPRVEGVHLRGGKVARGGVRWSDRREDFRTEVLGLMKAQQVKNSLIVPVGAKGGFFPKLLPLEADRDTIMKEVIFCYSTFIRGLLDLTDNIQDNKVIPCKDVIRYDDDDTYLVVAADKGTATFSDIANEISQEYNFWLKDAFASGGSSGYDHKKMGITARGAWVSVKRHFRELDMDPDKNDFTVIGIGDMSGDVFGNGMLLSKHIKLVAAFNHIHIFLDPNPDPQISFEERQRLFNLPRSTWMDYNEKLISAGGGVFNRSAKSIKLSEEVKNLLGIKKDVVVPNELIRAILRAPVDLIWNGGIGTYFKASYETNSDIGDRANDGVRIDANEISAKMAAEGGNLGFSQLARIEYSLNGGIINTDFVDNSGGVDCSDHEVNIKILLNNLVAEGKMTLAERNKLLEKMTDEIAELVLRDNYEQTQMLSLETSVALQTTDLFKRYISELEKKGRINRALEFLPDDKTLAERKTVGKALTRPEIAVLLAYCKMYLKQDILATDIPDDPYFTKHLLTAFPKVLCQKYFTDLSHHSLRREIIATQLGKQIGDHMGINFIERLQHETGATVAFIVRAFSVAENIFNMQELWRQIELLDFKVPASIQKTMMLQVYFLVRRATRWFLRNAKPDLDVETTIQDFAAPLTELMQHQTKLLTAAERQELAKETKLYEESGVPHALAKRIASCKFLFTALDIVKGMRKYNVGLLDMAITYYALGSRLELNWLREQVNAYPIENKWDELARSSLRDDLDRIQKKLSASVLSAKNKKAQNSKTIDERIDAWLDKNKILLERWQNLVTDVKASNNVAFVTYSVVMRELTDFDQPR